MIHKENTKFELTDYTKQIGPDFLPTTVYRIRALKDFADVKAGDYGGWVQSEFNLSTYGNSWIYDDACAYGAAVVVENARLKDRAYAGDCTTIDDNAIVTGQCNIRDTARIGGNARIDGRCYIGGDACIRGDTMLTGSIHINNAVRFSRTPTHYIVIGPIGSRTDTTTFYATEDGQIWAETGCFADTIEKFERTVKQTHEKNLFGLCDEYMAAIKTARDILKVKMINQPPLSMLDRL